MKNLKKVLALVLSMALMISTFTVSFAAEATKNLDKATKLNTMGLFNGESTTEFVPALEKATNRIQAMVIIGRMLGWDASKIKADKDSYEFTDVAEGEFADLAQYAFEKGITNGVGGHKFGSDDALTSRMLYAWYYAALGYGKASEAYNNPAVLVTSGVATMDTVSAITKETLAGKEAKLNRDALVGVMFDSLSWKAKDAKTTLIQDLVVNNKVDADKAVEAGVYVKPVVAFGVESVKTDNLKVVMVKFTQEVDKKSVNKTTIKLTDSKDKAATLTEVKLLEDKSTVALIVSNNGVAQSSQYKVEVNGVKNTSGEKIEKYKSELVTYTDTNLPQIESVVAVNAKQIKIVFTEPMNFTKSYYQTLGNVKRNGTTVIAKATAKHETNTIMLDLPSKMKDGTHKLEIKDMADFAGYKIVPQTFDIMIDKDETAPEIVSVEMRNKNTIRVTFNEKVEVKGKFKVNNTDETSNTSLVTDSNGTQYDITKAGLLDLSAVVEVKVEYKGQKDVMGNEVKDWKISTFSVEDDTTLPTVTNELQKGNKLVLTFSKTMKASTGKIKVVNSKKKTVKEFTVPASFKADTNNTVLELTSTSLGLDNINPGQYTVNIKGMKDATIRENILPETNIELAFADTKKPTVADKYTLKVDSADAKKNTVTFYFTEAMDVDTMKNLSNYVVNGGASLSSVTGAKVKEIAADGKSITIVYPNVAVADNKAFTIYAIKDIAGNMMVTNKTVGLMSSGSNITVTSVEATKKSEIVFTFSENIKTADPSVIEIQVGGTAYTVASNATIDGKKVKFTLNKEITSDVDKYNIVGTDNFALVKDVYGNTVATKAGLNKTATNITDKLGAEVVSVKRDETNTNEILVKFSEDVATNSVKANYKYDFKVVDTTDNVELKLNELDFEHTTDTIKITVMKSGVKDHEFSVQLLNGRSILDKYSNAGKAFATKTVEVHDSSVTAKITEKTGPKITSTSYNTSGKVLTIVFDEAIKTTDLDAAAEITAITLSGPRTYSVAQDSHIVWSSDKKTVNITLVTSDVAAGDTITAITLTDALGNLVDLNGSSDKTL